MVLLLPQCTANVRPYQDPLIIGFFWEKVIHNREKCVVWAINYPFRCSFRNKPANGKDRQRYALYLTVFWFPSMCTLEKTVRNTVKLSGYRRVKTLDALPIFFLVQ